MPTPTNLIDDTDKLTRLVHNNEVEAALEMAKTLQRKLRRVRFDPIEASSTVHVMIDAFAFSKTEVERAYTVAQLYARRSELFYPQYPRLEVYAGMSLAETLLARAAWRHPNRQIKAKAIVHATTAYEHWRAMDDLIARGSVTTYPMDAQALSDEVLAACLGIGVIAARGTDWAEMWIEVALEFLFLGEPNVRKLVEAGDTIRASAAVIFLNVVPVTLRTHAVVCQTGHAIKALGRAEDAWLRDLLSDLDVIHRPKVPRYVLTRKLVDVSDAQHRGDELEARRMSRLAMADLIDGGLMRHVDRVVEEGWVDLSGPDDVAA